MPYKNIAPEDTAKVDQCVKDLVAKGKDESSAFAICIKQFSKATMEPTQNSIAVETNESPGSLIPTVIKVVPFGSIEQSTQYPGLKFTNEQLNEMKANFDSGKVPEIPIDFDHPEVSRGDSTKAAGWVKALEVRENDGLYASVDWTPLGEQAIHDKIYRGWSPEWSFDFTDPETGDGLGAILYAVSLTNRRLFRQNLPAFAAGSTTRSTSGIIILPILNAPKMANMKNKTIKKAAAEETKSEPEVKPEPVETKPEESKKAQMEMDKEEMDLSAILAKEPKALSQEELAMLSRMWDELDDTAKAKFKDVVAAYTSKQSAAAEPKVEAPKVETKVEEKPKEEPKVEPKEAPAEEKIPEPAVEVASTKPEVDKAAVDNSETKVAVAELEDLKKAAAELKKAQVEMATMKASADFDNRYSLKVADGMLAPVCKDAFIEFRLTASNRQNELLDAMLKGVQPKKIMGEIGSASKVELSNTEQLNKLIDDEMKSDKSLSFDAAMRIAANKNKELVNKIYPR